MTAAPSASVGAAALHGLGAMAVLTVMDALVKAASASLPTAHILWLRYLLTALLAAGVIALLRRPWPRRDALGTHAVRAALMVVSNGAFFYALGALPFAEVFALSYTAPIFMVLFGVLLLGEPVSARTVAAVALGFAGVLIVALGQAGNGAAGRPPLALAAACVAPVVYALSIVLLRKQATGEAALQIVLSQSALVALFVTPLLLVTGPPALPARVALEIAAIGVTSLAGYLLLVRALAGLTAVRYSVIEYTALLWAAAIGWLFFAEWPGWSLWVGAALIVAGALVALAPKKAGTP